MKLLFILMLLNPFTCYSKDKWRFIVYGNTRNNNTQHQKILKSIQKNSSDYKFIINTGDITSNGENVKQWDKWKKSISSELKNIGQNNNPPKYIASPGDHDKITTKAGYKNWNKYLSGQKKYKNKGEYFYFDYKDARFIVLNSERNFGKQMRFLIDVLKKKPKKWLFAIWHKPIYSFGGYLENIILRSTWGELLYKAGCDIIFVGHSHYYVRTKKLSISYKSEPPVNNISGTTEIITGNGGAKLEKINLKNKKYMVAKTFDNYGYTEINIKENNLTLKHISDNNQIKDEATFKPNKKNPLK